MVKTGNCLGGEQSGRSIFLEYETTDDGILTILKLMEVMLAVETSLSSLAVLTVFIHSALKCAS